MSTSREPDSEIDSVLEFWLGAADPPGAAPPAVAARWWKKDPEFDAHLRSRFGELHTRASTGQLDAWAAAPRGRSALVIVLDQFSRNLYRSDPRAFAQDTRCLELALEGIARGEHERTRPLLAYFGFMPLMHSEDLATQDRGVELFAWGSKHFDDPEVEKLFADGADYARRHRDIVARFGRFPHRNAALGRRSSPEELEFLKQPGSSF
ncbi:MAG: DUF924 family protein [Polyangiaceae bacterium]